MCSKNNRTAQEFFNDRIAEDGCLCEDCFNWKEEVPKMLHNYAKEKIIEVVSLVLQSDYDRRAEYDLIKFLDSFGLNRDLSDKK